MIKFWLGTIMMAFMVHGQFMRDFTYPGHDQQSHSSQQFRQIQEGQFQPFQRQNSQPQQPQQQQSSVHRQDVRFDSGPQQFQKQNLQPQQQQQLQGMKRQEERTENNLQQVQRQNSEPQPQVNHGVEAITDGIISFSWQLFENIDKTKNIAISPLAPQLLLAYLNYAADGKTKQQIDSAIRSLSTADMNSKLEQVLGKSNSNNFLSIKTAFYVDQNVRFQGKFKKQADTYNIGTFNVDFNNPSLATNTINNWISSSTKGLIKQAVNPSTDTTGVRLMLINAIAFNGMWKKPFVSTSQGEFELAKDNFKTVNYMNKIDMLYAGTANLEGHYKAIWVEIPYDKNEYSMYVLIPNERFHMEHMIKHMTVENLKKIVFEEKSDYKKEVNLTMPKFKIETSTSLKTPLHNMGITDLFTASSNLPFIAEQESLKVADVIQTVVMEVDERGTKAAAATVVNVITLSLTQDPQKFELLIDQPFLVIIVDNKNMVPLFMAKIDNP